MKLFYVCVAWMAGIGIGSLFPLPMLAYLLSGIFAFLLALTFANKFQLGLVCVAVCLLGGARYISAQPPDGPASLSAHIGETVTVEGLLEEDATISGKGVRVRAGGLRLHLSNGQVLPLEGKALLEFSQPPEKWSPTYGDAVLLRGRMDPPPAVEGFDYAAYLARQEVFAVLRNPAVQKVTSDQGGWLPAAMHALRRKGMSTIAAIFPEPESALLQGILLGDDSGIPQNISDAFAQTV